MSWSSGSYAFRPRSKKSYLCVVPKCTKNISPSLRTGTCFDHKDIDSKLILEYKILRDLEIRNKSK